MLSSVFIPLVYFLSPSFRQAVESWMLKKYTKGITTRTSMFILHVYPTCLSLKNQHVYSSGRYHGNDFDHSGVAGLLRYCRSTTLRQSEITAQ